MEEQKKNPIRKDEIHEPWLSWARELQFISQSALAYCKDPFDIERFQRIREISAEMISYKSGIPIEKVNDLFCNEEGYQTPKLDCRGAVFQDGKILLVREQDGKWALPGGWVDVNQTVEDNTVKEVKEEAGLDVKAVKLIALQDQDRDNMPVFAYGICKVFFLCDLIGGEFKENTETTESGYFALSELPELATIKTTRKQIELCFAAYEDENWQTVFC